MTNATTAADFVTREGHWIFLALSPEVVAVEHWPSRPTKRGGYARGSTLSRKAATALYRKLKARAL